MKVFLAFLIITNLATFIAYGVDKRKAVKDRWRISEKTLLMMGLMFGSVGQLLGMKVFRHKTNKWYFWFCGMLSFVLQAVIIYYFYTKILV